MQPRSVYVQGVGADTRVSLAELTPASAKVALIVPNAKKCKTAAVRFDDRTDRFVPAGKPRIEWSNFAYRTVLDISTVTPLLPQCLG